jgi:hypothetical protein
MKTIRIFLPLFLSIVALISVLGLGQSLADVKAQIEGATNFTGVHIQATALGTATPLLHIRNDGNPKSLEIENSSGTPVFDVAGDGTWSAAGAPTLSNGLTVSSGGMTVSAGLAVFSGGINCTPQTATVAAGFVLTPTSCIISMTSSGEVTSSTTTGIITTTATSGDIVVLANNNAADVLNIDGTGGTIECKANVALGASDTLTLWYNGTDAKWNCLSSYDNS